MEYHPYAPAPGGICAVCSQAAMSPQHVVGYKPPGAVAPPDPQSPEALRALLGTIVSVPPAPAIVPEPTQAPAAASTPAPGTTPEPVVPDITEPVWVSPEEQTPAEVAEVQRMSATVELAFPVLGFIDPAVELEKMLRITQRMNVDEKQQYPEKIRAAILAHEAGKGPEVSDEDLALAIFIQRTTYIPLSEEELEAKATGKKKRDPSEPKPKRVSKKAQSSLEQLNDLGI